MATTVAPAGPGSGYPVRLDIEYPQELNRWLPLVKWLLAIPHFIVLYFLLLAAYVVAFIAFFAILFTKRYPKEFFEFVANTFRWSANVNAYYLLMRDEYPPFSFDRGVYPVTFEVDYPEEMSRWLPLVKWLLAIPHYIVLLFLGIVLYVVLIIAFFSILFTKKFPESLFRFAVGTQRWGMRVNAYVYLMRDEYPPFSLEP
jgi:Domain of unknown function (DUF4389)